MINFLDVGGVLTLNKPFELEPNSFGTPVTPNQWLKVGMLTLHIATPDFHAPTIEEITTCVQFIRSVTATGKAVYVHCKVQQQNRLF